MRTLSFLLLATLILPLPTSAQQAGEPCLEIMVPLYTYPLWFDPANYIWDDIAAAAADVPVTAVLNPADGPTAKPNADYLVGLADLEAGGVEGIGYVFTSFGTRPIDEVKADIDVWVSAWSQWIRGIFFDEASASAADLDYYAELYDYVQAQPGLDLVVTNQGTTADEGYLSRPAADVVLSFENFSSAWDDWTVADYASFYPRNRFSMLAHEVPDVATLESQIALAPERNYGYIYLTDDLFVPNPWDSLPSFWQEEVDAVAEINASCREGSGSFAADDRFSPTGTIEAGAGTQIGWLEGPDAANADLALFERTANGWQRVEVSSGPRTDEHLAVITGAGTFAWAVLVRSGEGDYTFNWIAPQQ